MECINSRRGGKRGWETPFFLKVLVKADDDTLLLELMLLITISVLTYQHYILLHCVSLPLEMHLNNILATL